MQKQNNWLRDEIEQWRAEGLIDDSIASQLAARYPVTERAWSKLIFSAIGAVLAGLGLILFFAYNWEDLPKLAKLALVFAALGGSHGTALWLDRSGAHPRSLVEGLHLVGTMAFGAGIWLIAQIYHIDEHYPNAFLLWSLGALTLAWSLPSLMQGFLAVLLISLWAGFEAIDFHWVNHWAPILVLFGVIPLAWAQRSRVLLFFGLLALQVVLILVAIPVEDELLVALTFFTSCVYILCGLWASQTAFAQSHSVFKLSGFAGYLALLYVFSFVDGVDLLADLEFVSVAVGVYFGLPLALTVAAWVLTVGRTGPDELWRWHWGLLAVSVLMVTVVASEQLGLGGWGAAIPFNLLYLAHCVLFIVQGSRAANAKLVSVACVLFAVLVVTRYVDLFESLLVRSAIFLLMGAGLFVVGNFYSKSRRAM